MLHNYLTHYGERLTAAGAWGDLAPADVHAAALTIGWELVHGGEGAALRQRADAITDGSSGGWCHPAGVARALRTAASELELL